jgi:TM2 domain-containing membrane protein YozV
MRTALVLLLFIGLGSTSRAAGPFKADAGTVLRIEWTVNEGDGEEDFHPSRALAVGLAVALGPFGAHRLYFGTTPKVPVLYALTFGGFGILVLIDIGHILFTKDLTGYLENDRVLMWAKPQSEKATPP